MLMDSKIEKHKKKSCYSKMRYLIHKDFIRYLSMHKKTHNKQEE